MHQRFDHHRNSGISLQTHDQPLNLTTCSPRRDRSLRPSPVVNTSNNSIGCRGQSLEVSRPRPLWTIGGGVSGSLNRILPSASRLRPTSNSFDGTRLDGNVIQRMPYEATTNDNVQEDDEMDEEEEDRENIDPSPSSSTKGKSSRSRVPSGKLATTAATVAKSNGVSPSVSQSSVSRRRPILTPIDAEFTMFVRKMTSDLLEHQLPMAQQSLVHLALIEDACRAKFPHYDMRQIRLKIRSQLKRLRCAAAVSSSNSSVTSSTTTTTSSSIGTSGCRSDSSSTTIVSNSTLTIPLVSQSHQSTQSAVVKPIAPGTISSNMIGPPTSTHLPPPPPPPPPPMLMPRDVPPAHHQQQQQQSGLRRLLPNTDLSTAWQSVVRPPVGPSLFVPSLINATNHPSLSLPFLPLVETSLPQGSNTVTGCLATDAPATSINFGAVPAESFLGQQQQSNSNNCQPIATVSSTLLPPLPATSALLQRPSLFGGTIGSQGPILLFNNPALNYTVPAQQHLQLPVPSAATSNPLNGGFPISGSILSQDDSIPLTTNPIDGNSNCGLTSNQLSSNLASTTTPIAPALCPHLINLGDSISASCQAPPPSFLGLPSQLTVDPQPPTYSNLLAASLRMSADLLVQSARLLELIASNQSTPGVADQFNLTVPKLNAEPVPPDPLIAMTMNVITKREEDEKGSTNYDELVVNIDDDDDDGESQVRLVVEEEEDRRKEAPMDFSACSSPSDTSAKLMIDCSD